MDAPVSRVFAALVDRNALEAWLPPDGMTARFERFDPTPGGSYRLVLTYVDPAGAPVVAPAVPDLSPAAWARVLDSVDHAPAANDERYCDPT